MKSFEEHNAPSLPSRDVNAERSTNSFFAAGALDADQPDTVLHFIDGTSIRISTAQLLSTTKEKALRAKSYEDHLADEGTITVPVIEERLAVGKRTIVTGTVRLDRHTVERQQVLNEPLSVQTYDVDRVAVDIPVASIPAVREEGDVMIFPVTEQRLTLTTQLFLVEEVRITKRVTEQRDTRTVTLQREDISVTRIAANDGVEAI